MCQWYQRWVMTQAWVRPAPEHPSTRRWADYSWLLNYLLDLLTFQILCWVWFFPPCHSQCCFCSITQPWWANHTQKILGMKEPMLTVVLTSIYQRASKKTKKLHPAKKIFWQCQMCLTTSRHFCSPFIPNWQYESHPALAPHQISLISAVFWM